MQVGVKAPRWRHSEEDLTKRPPPPSPGSSDGWRWVVDGSRSERVLSQCLFLPSWNVIPLSFTKTLIHWQPPKTTNNNPSASRPAPGSHLLTHPYRGKYTESFGIQHNIFHLHIESIWKMHKMNLQFVWNSISGCIHFFFFVTPSFTLYSSQY